MSTDCLALAEKDEDQLNWKNILGPEREKQYFKDLLAFIERERAAKKIIYPANSEIFSSLSLCPFPALKAVILGQDPYHGPGQAHGLSFSVKPGVRFPPSLRNIFLELQKDLGQEPPQSGELSRWASQGVLLLNSVLSVEAGKAGSHANLGWETFTDKIVAEINQQKSSVVFMLWGAYAQKKGALIDCDKHLVLKAAHPSPFSAHNGFFGCRHFSKCNDYLIARGHHPISW